jgi:AmmeMemoRadiSam system protein B
MCGVIPAVIVLQTLQYLGELSWQQEVAYATSAEAGGSHERVVGYAGLLWG